MLARFEELTDDQWKLLVPSIPVPAHTGRPRADDRSTINGILYVLLSGCRWMECLQSMAHTKQFGDDTRSGVSKMYGKINIMNSLISCGYTSGLINNMDDLSVDSSTVASKKEGKK